MSDETKNGSNPVAEDEELDFDKYLEAAEHGDAEAQYKVGNAYYRGNGVLKDKTEAFRWFLKAAEQGHADAQYMAGKCYYYANGVKENKTEAFKWYKKASEQEKFSDQLSNKNFVKNAPKIFAVLFRLGKCYWNGAGVPVNEDEAFKCWGRAGLTVLKLVLAIVLFFVFVLSVPALILFLILPHDSIENTKQPDYDYVMCEEVRKENSSESWERYLENYPDGNCVEEAEAFLDITACENARHDNTRVTWERYLKDFQDGKCAEEGKSFKNKYKITGGLEWSDSILTRSNLDSYDDQYGDTYVSWKLAKRYCEELKEDDQEDWRLPTVEELKMLVENCSGDSEKEGECLYRKMQGTDVVGLWGYSDEDSVWYANTKGIQEDNIYSSRSVRCVRQDERETCEAARKYSSKYLWHFYFENFPEGECISDARIFLEKSMCEDARKKNTRAAWEKYLKKFPDGKCAKEGMAVRNKFRKIDGLEWSDIFHAEFHADSGYNYDPFDYCDHDAWRLPTIDELRTLVQNHPGTVQGGLCKISEKDGKTWIELDESSSCDGIEGGNFSKLGDDVQLLSSTTAWGLDYQSGRANPYWSWFLDFTNGAIVYNRTKDYSDIIGVNFRCVRQDDLDACKTAREESTEYSWEEYLKKFPDGKCVEEAKAGPKDELVCKKARKLNTRAAWEEYLKKFPDGKCAKEGKAVRNQFKRIGTLEWSDVIKSFDYEEDAVLFCENLVEDGYADWRMPNIDELRTLIINNPNKVVDGTCDFEDDICDLEGLGGSNKLGDTDWLWSSSSVKGDRDKRQAVYFGQGRLVALAVGNIFFDMRCVRQNDHDACETAKKYNEFYYWKHYLENYPKGKCVKEAKTALKELEESPCKNAETGKDTWELENYLRDFPNGKCAKEARDELDKEACEKARGEYRGWENYLRDFPNGRCAKEARDELDKEACEFARQDKKYLWWWKRYLKDFPEGKCAKEAENSLKNMDQKACE